MSILEEDGKRTLKIVGKWCAVVVERLHAPALALYGVTCEWMWSRPEVWFTRP
jgi:hypothetical protein